LLLLLSCCCLLAAAAAVAAAAAAAALFCSFFTNIIQHIWCPSIGCPSQMSTSLSLALLAACDSDDVSGLLQGGQLLQQAIMEMGRMVAHDTGSAMTVCRRLLQQQQVQNQLQTLAEILRALFDGPLSEARIPPRAHASLLREVCAFINSSSHGVNSVLIAATATAEAEAAVSRAVIDGSRPSPTAVADCVEVAGGCLPAATGSSPATLDAIRRVFVTACSGSVCAVDGGGAGATAVAEVLCTSSAACGDLFTHVAAAVAHALQLQLSDPPASAQNNPLSSSASIIAIVAACGRCVQFIAVKLSSPHQLSHSPASASSSTYSTWRRAATLWMDVRDLPLLVLLVSLSRSFSYNFPPLPRRRCHWLLSAVLEALFLTPSPCCR
jgi:hypothetical protein